MSAAVKGGLALLVLSFAMAAAGGSANAAGLAATPPMGVNPYGYNSLANYDDTSRCHWDLRPDYGNYDLWPCQMPATPSTMRAQARALVTPITRTGKSLADLGYTLIQLDGEWQGPRNGPDDEVTGQPTLTPNPRRFGTARDFRALIRSLTHDYVSPKYGRHLEVGIYSDIYNGINCGQPADWAYWDTGNGLYGHEVTDARTFASWGITAIKIDHMCGDPPDGEQAELGRIRDAFATYAPKIWTNYWGPQDQTHVWRSADECGCFDDPGHQWPQDSVLEYMDRAVDGHYADLVGPSQWSGGGRWFDMDPLLVSGNQGFGGPNGGIPGLYLSQREQQSQFAIEALFASPLLIGTDLRKPVGVAGNEEFPGDPFALSFLANEELIRVDQDPRGDMARVVEGDQVNDEVLAKVLSGSGHRAVGLLNRTDGPRRITVHFDRLRRDDGGPGGMRQVTRVRDLWRHAAVPASEWNHTGSYTATVPAHGIDVLEIWGT